MAEEKTAELPYDAEKVAAQSAIFTPPYAEYKEPVYNIMEVTEWQVRSAPDSYNFKGYKQFTGASKEACEQWVEKQKLIQKLYAEINKLQYGEGVNATYNDWDYDY